MKRINFNVPDEVHQHCKEMALRRGKSMKEMFIICFYKWLKTKEGQNELPRPQKRITE